VGRRGLLELRHRRLDVGDWASASGSARSSAAVGNSSGLIWPSSRSHSFDQLENQPKSVEALRQAPKPASDAASSGSAFSVSASQ
jgi:hypothetical protein